MREKKKSRHDYSISEACFFIGFILLREIKFTNFITKTEKSSTDSIVNIMIMRVMSLTFGVHLAVVVQSHVVLGDGICLNIFCFSLKLNG